MKVIFLFLLLFSSGVYAGFDEIVGKPLELPKGIKYETGCLHDGDAVLSMTVKEFDEKLLKSGGLIQGVGDLSEISSENVVELMVEKFCDKPQKAKLLIANLIIGKVSAERLSMYLSFLVRPEYTSDRHKLWKVNGLSYSLTFGHDTADLAVKRIESQ